MTVHYKSFDEVYMDANNFRNEAELRQAFVEALKSELRNGLCKDYIVEQWLIPAIDEWVGRGRERGRPDVRVSTLIVELKRPSSNINTGVNQLKEYMKSLYEEIGGRAVVYGLLTNGIDAMSCKYYGGNNPSCGQKGKMPEVARALLTEFCSSKIPVVKAEDLVRLFGV